MDPTTSTSPAGCRPSRAEKPDALINPMRFATHDVARKHGEPYTHSAFGHMNAWGAHPQMNPTAWLPSIITDLGQSVTALERRAVAEREYENPIEVADGGRVSVEKSYSQEQSVQRIQQRFVDERMLRALRREVQNRRRLAAISTRRSRQALREQKEEALSNAWLRSQAKAAKKDHLIAQARKSILPHFCDVLRLESEGQLPPTLAPALSPDPAPALSPRRRSSTASLAASLDASALSRNPGDFSAFSPDYKRELEPSQTTRRWSRQLVEEPPPLHARAKRQSAKQLNTSHSVLAYSSNYSTAYVKTPGPASQLGSPRANSAQGRVQLFAAGPSLTGRLPKLHSLMNPTKRPTSAVPDPATWCPPELLPAHLTPSMTHVLPAPSHWDLGKLLLTVRRLLEAQRNAEEAASAQAKLRPGRSPYAKALLNTLAAKLTHEYGLAQIADGKIAELIENCNHHRRHPRIELFRQLAGFAAEQPSWKADKIRACVDLVYYLVPQAESEPTAWGTVATSPSNSPRSPCREPYRRPVGPETTECLVPLAFAQKVLNVALKEGTVPKKPHFAKRSLDEAAEDLAEERRREVAKRMTTEEAALEAEELMVDADALMLRWMEVWGEWPTRK